MWKYFQPSPTTKANPLTGEEQARAHFCVNDTDCPIVELDNGQFAVWCAAPLKGPKEYPDLHHKPANSKSKFASIHDKG